MDSLKKVDTQKVYNWQFWTPSFLILAKTSLGEIVELNHRYYNIRDKKVLEELWKILSLGQMGTCWKSAVMQRSARE